MKDLKYIAGEISKGKNLDINLEKYATGMCSFYNTLACIKLAMNYYTVYDMYNEQPVKEHIPVAYFSRLISRFLPLLISPAIYFKSFIIKFLNFYFKIEIIRINYFI